MPAGQSLPYTVHFANAPGDAAYNSGCKADWMRDWAWDEAAHLLYASEPRAYRTADGSNRMIVHVWQVN